MHGQRNDLYPNPPHTNIAKTVAHKSESETDRKRTREQSCQARDQQQRCCGGRQYVEEMEGPWVDASPARPWGREGEKGGGGGQESKEKKGR
ncbi:hypothetical protein EYF80_020075 [Liparis tanakae]|uniref:Uncharacterized protein n=1 Tax=Liparis tanakae TaxID=230148 RepID=A0A4Z2HVU4_9TELE|nr:hypothetical protein EYF80_020075 [Liparis tanakae]